MNKITPILISLLFISLLFSCNNNKLISDKSIRSGIESGYADLKDLNPPGYRELFKAIDSKELTGEEEDAIMFLLSSMPLNDLADYDGDFFLENVRSSLRARYDFPWTGSVPEDIFLHFVLPVRVNNENLDSFRIKYYDELKERVAAFNNISEAALEINHWCHEKVSYQGADIRTSAPMATILSGRGRCGEESTFTVAALRTAGIPARQVYVPRWSHSDDNHAWVEIWDSGEWKYLGACEPEPVLNRGWFTGAASRAMLVHTRSFGPYHGSEKLVRRNLYSGEINNLSLYADTRPLVVKVTDADRRPVEEALVEYKVFNYAEYYTLAAIYTDSQGFGMFETGYGDLMVWASKDGDFGFDVVTVAEKDTVELVLAAGMEDGEHFLFDHFVPPANRDNPEVSKEQQATNMARLKEEDRIRQGYISGWIDQEGVRAFASEYAYNYDDIMPVFSRSMGNYREIATFLKRVAENKKEDAIKLLKVSADKDLRDTPAAVFLDHLENLPVLNRAEYPEAIYMNYVLNPRVANEILTPWRKYLQDQLGDTGLPQYLENPQMLAGWINERVQLRDSWNYYRVPISPRGTLELGLSDMQSRDILFVSLSRSIGVPARLDKAGGRPQYYYNGSWINARFDLIDDAEDTSSARLTLSVRDQGKPIEYYRHFTIARIRDGVSFTLKYEHGKDISDFEWPLYLQPGEYVLFSGNRLGDTRILSEAIFFKLSPGEERLINFTLREETGDHRVIQNIKPGSRVYNGKEMIPVSGTGQTGSVIAWINHEKEPSKHFLSELRRYKSHLDKWQGQVFLISDSSYLTESFTLSSDTLLPDNTVLGFETGSRLLRKLFPKSDSLNPSFPVILYVNKNNEVLFMSEGYRLGLCNQLLDYIYSDKE